MIQRVIHGAIDLEEVDSGASSAFEMRERSPIRAQGERFEDGSGQSPTGVRDLGRAPGVLSCIFGLPV